MTPQLQQAIKLLQLSRLDLVQTVQTELLENPLLEEIIEEEAGDHSRRDDLENGSQRQEDSISDEQTRRELMQNAEWDDYLGQYSSSSRQAQSRETETQENKLSSDARLSAKPSLEGHLEWQLRLSDFTEKEKEIGETIIGNLSSTGYLHAELEELAELTQSSVEEVENVLVRIQLFDPIGVAARSPRECLTVQLLAAGYTDKILLELVNEHLEDLEKRRYKPLCRKFGLDLEDLKAYLDIIQSLVPMPGASFGSGDTIYISPDAYVFKGDEDFVIVLNEEGLPRLGLSSVHIDESRLRDSKDRAYFQERTRSAQWLIRSLYQRQRTLYKVLESLLNFQREFFEEGVSKLKPLILRQVAEDIGMHESTISRITTNKYVSTPHGVYELKFFFNSSLDMADGSTMGSESVKSVIRGLINDEDPKRPISDEAIAEILKKKLDVNIARRTVAKYRSTMGIESSSKRREIF